MWTDMWEDEMLTQQNTKLLGEWKIVKPLVRFSPLVMQKVKCSLRVKPEDRSCCQFCLLTKTFGHYIKNPLTHQAQTERSRSSVLSHGLNVLYLELQFNSLHTATVHADVSMLMSYSALAIWLWSSWSIIMICVKCLIRRNFGLLSQGISSICRIQPQQTFALANLASKSFLSSVWTKVQETQADKSDVCGWCG